MSAAIAAIVTPVAIWLASFSTSATVDAVNPNFTIQHYFYFSGVQTATGTEDVQYPFINTSDSTPSVLPANHNKTGVNLVNGVTPNAFHVPLIANESGDYELAVNSSKTLTQMFEDEPTNYRSNPQIGYMSRLFNDGGDYNSDYTLLSVWVYQPPESGAPKATSSLEESDFIKYPVPFDSETSRHLPERIRFTNNPDNPRLSAVNDSTPVANTNLTNYPYTYTILIKEGTVVRLVFDTTTGVSEQSADFFDYDISDGCIYSSATSTTCIPTSTQSSNPSTTYYAKTYQNGINSASNYVGSGAKFGFGNANAGTGVDPVIWTDANGNKLAINTANSTSTASRYGNITNYLTLGFDYVQGLAKSTNSDRYVPVFADGIVAPKNLFDSGVATGKTNYTNGEFSLGFKRTGATYALSYVKNNLSSETLDVGNFVVSYTYSNGNKLYSNEFWPMDMASSWGANGKDMKFGNYSNRAKRMAVGKKWNNTSKTLVNSTSNLPTSDIGVDHNSYFGMSYSIDFSVEPGYMAPLDYWFYGDDDMWGFLSEVDPTTGGLIDSKKIADLGGVHSAAGLYANLWEYIPFNPLFNQDGTENHTKKYYRLNIFFLERGASGSNCYMRFTVPIDTSISPAPTYGKALVVETKTYDSRGNLLNYDADDHSFNYTINLGNSDGYEYGDLYAYAIYRRDTTPDHEAASAVPVDEGIVGNSSRSVGSNLYTFSLKSGEYIVIEELMNNTLFSIESSEDEEYDSTYRAGTHLHDGLGGVTDNLLDTSLPAGGTSETYALASRNYVLFENTVMGHSRIEINATVSGNLADTDKCFAYELSFPANANSYSFVSDTACEGNASQVNDGSIIHLKHGDSATIGFLDHDEIEVDTAYSITAVSASGYNSSIDNASVTVVSKQIQPDANDNITDVDRSKATATVLTGVDTEDPRTYIVIMIIGVIGMALILIKSKRR